MATKVTFTLDEPTIRRLQAASEQLKKPKSQIVRDAISDLHEGLGRLSETERQRQLRVIRDLVPSIPLRPQQDVDHEIAEIRSARRSGGRGGNRRGSR
jgi:predicted transcriptional regulator